MHLGGMSLLEAFLLRLFSCDGKVGCNDRCRLEAADFDDSFLLCELCVMQERFTHGHEALHFTHLRSCFGILARQNWSDVCFDPRGKIGSDSFLRIAVCLECPYDVGTLRGIHA